MFRRTLCRENLCSTEFLNSRQWMSVRYGLILSAVSVENRTKIFKNSWKDFVVKFFSIELSLRTIYGLFPIFNLVEIEMIFPTDLHWVSKRHTEWQLSTFSWLSIKTEQTFERRIFSEFFLRFFVAFSNCFNMTCVGKLNFIFICGLYLTFAQHSQREAFVFFSGFSCLLMLTHPTTSRVINTCCALNWQKRKIFIK